MSLVSVRTMKLLEKFEAVARERRLADNTIDAYRGWIEQFLRFCAAARGQWTRAEELGTADVETFLGFVIHLGELVKFNSVIFSHEKTDASNIYAESKQFF